MRTKQTSLAIAALLAGAATAWLAANRTFVPYQTASVPIGLLVGWSFIGSGLAACRVRPDNRLGKAMVFTGFAWFASALTDAHPAILFTVGLVVQEIYLIGVGYVVVTFPSGRPQTTFERVLIWSAVALLTVVQLFVLLFYSPDQCPECPPANLLAVAPNNSVSNVLAQLQRLSGLTLILLVVGLVVLRWKRATAPQRRNVAAVALAGAATLGVLAVGIANDVLGEPLGQAPKQVGFVVLASLPVAVLYFLVQQRLARAAVAGLVVELGEREVPSDLRKALARALRDASLDVAYWFSEAARYVDGEGRPVELPRPESGRMCTVVERNGQPIAALIHDRALEDNAELIDSVCAAAAMTLENERLQAELRARLGELHASRARLVDATEAERRRIERDLHDGTQQRLVSLAMSLGLLDTKLPEDPQAAKPIAMEARAALAVALEELRELSQGIHPAVLTERGLGAALDELADRAAVPAYVEVSIDVRPCPAVEAAAYFVVSEALTNAAKHSHAGEVRIAAWREQDRLMVEVADDGIGGAAGRVGSGLRGLTDRVEALGRAVDGVESTRTWNDPEGGAPVRVVVADDAVILREGVARLLSEAGFEVAGLAGDADELFSLIERHRPDVAIVDIRMPPTHTDEGLRAAKLVRERWPHTGVLVLSQHVRASYARELLSDGTNGLGYLLKERVSDLAELASSVERIGNGGSALDPAVVEQLVGRPRRRGDALEHLTRRERDVLALMAEGRSNKAIAERLVVTEHTVEKHVKNILGRLRLRQSPDDHRRVLAVLTYLYSR